jgi:competence protein ComEC
MLVDGGPGGGDRFSVGERVVAPFLWNLPARRVDVVALSHPDSDHAGGLVAVLRHFRVGEFWDNGASGPAAGDLRAALTRSGTPRRVLRTGDRLWLGTALVSVLHPDRVGASRANDDSLVLRLDWRGVSLLLTGDVGLEGEARLLAGGPPGRAVALKVAHHGSRSSSGAPFLEATRPALAIVSVGARNPFRHPTAESLARLGAAGARVYRTDRDGAVVLETDGARVWVTAWARGTVEHIDLDPERPPAGDDAPGAGHDGGAALAGA